MKITYTGRQIELAPAQFKKLEARFTKIGKILDGKRECEAHVILSLERHLHHAEATVNVFNHQLAGLGSDTDLFNAIHAAAEKLEKQALKAVTKWRDNKRVAKPGVAAAEEEGPLAPEEAETGPQSQVHHVNHFDRRKPMTLDEAMLELDKDRDYLVYRDSQSGRVCVLIRRRDGHFDLVEA